LGRLSFFSLGGKEGNALSGREITPRENFLMRGDHHERSTTGEKGANGKGESPIAEKKATRELILRVGKGHPGLLSREPS